MLNRKNEPGADVTRMTSHAGDLGNLSAARPRITALSALSWAVLSVAAGAALFLGATSAREQLREQQLRSADEATLQAVLGSALQAHGSPDRFEMIAEHALHAGDPALALAEEAASRAVALDPSRAHAWSVLAYASRQEAGRLGPEAIRALSRSMDACGFCDDALIRWRFNFVLANWTEAPEPVRRRVFEQAELLRWSGQNAEFLAEMRLKAESAGIPYAAYRDAVRSPVPALGGAGVPQAAPSDPVQDQTRPQ